MYEIALCFRLKPYIPPSTAAQPAAQETGFSWESVPVGSGGHCWSPQEGGRGTGFFSPGCWEMSSQGITLSQHFLVLSSLLCFSSSLMPQALVSLRWSLGFSGSVYRAVERAWGLSCECAGQCWTLQRRKKKNRKELPLGSGSVWSDPKTRVLSFCQYFCLLWSRLQGGIFLHLNCIQECVSS